MPTRSAAGACCALALVLVVLTGGVASAAKRGPLALGVLDSVYRSSDGAARGLWLDRTVDAGAGAVTLQASWRDIAPASRPADPDDPADPGYDWTLLDAAIRDATARGLSVMVMINQAPDWAEGPGRNPRAPPGTWRPDPDLLGEFAGAIGQRYSGEFPDPLAPDKGLPRVDLWEVWGEPNIPEHLTPQWERSGGGWRTASPQHYRRLVNAAYAALKAVDPTNRVVAGGLALAGDYTPGGGRLPPLRFWREFFCLRGRKLKPRGCGGEKPHLDVLGHNPLSVYASAGPFRSAPQPDDVYVPDMHELARVIRAARAHRRIVPRRGTELWATELLAWTKPPVSYGLSESGQANYLADALFVLWKQGVSQVFWVGIRDGDFGSGLHRNDGTPKLAAEAFRFPFVAREKGKGRVRVWGRAPVDGPVQIEQQTGAGFEPIATLTPREAIFSGVVRPERGAKLRATAGGEHSLAR